MEGVCSFGRSSASKGQLISDGQGVPLAIQLNGANRNDSQQALALVDAILPLQGELGRPRHRPDCLLGDRVMTPRQSSKVCVTAASCFCSRCATPSGLALLATLDIVTMAARPAIIKLAVSLRCAFVNFFTGFLGSAERRLRKELIRER